ncbi:hypothetical protein STRIP9103_04222, partial [Streptomyces ipomoeae 91-03]
MEQKGPAVVRARARGGRGSVAPRDEVRR